MRADGFFGAAAFAHVAMDAAGEADVGWGVDVDGEGVEGQQLCVMQCEDAFDEDVLRGSEGLELVGDPGVGGEIVDRALDGFAGGDAG